jgi:hypothetical protein
MLISLLKKLVFSTINSERIYLYLLIFSLSVLFISGSTTSVRLLISLIAALIYFYHCYKGRGQSANVFIDIVAYSFGFYFLLQSPIFSQVSSNNWMGLSENFYFLVKAIIIVVLVILQFGLKKNGKPRYRPFVPVFLLFIFYADVLIINKVNLGIFKTATEYYSIWEALISLYLVQLVINNNQKITHQLKSNYLLLLFVAGHAANYFAAGFSKFSLNGGALSWLDNPTFVTLKRADLWGLTVPGWLLENKSFLLFEPIGNFLVYSAQLASLLIFIIPQFMAPLTLFFDVFHIGVGTLAGVWFYKWILVNLIIFWKRRDFVFSVLSLRILEKVSLTLLIPLFFYIASVPHLGWYEYYQGSLIYAYGVKPDNTRDRLGHQFFGSAAFTILDKQTYSLFDSGFTRQMAGLDNKELKRSKECNRLVSSYDKFHPYRKNVEEISKRVLEDRSTFSSTMYALQPYHLLIPSQYNNDHFNNNIYNAIEYELMHICLEKDYSVNKIDHVDTYKVLKR